MWKDHTGDLGTGGRHKLEENFMNCHHSHILFSIFSQKQLCFCFRLYNVQRLIKRKYFITGVAHTFLNWWGHEQIRFTLPTTTTTRGRFAALYKCSNFKSACFMLHSALLRNNFGIILCSKNIPNEGPAPLWSLAEHLSSMLEIQSTLRMVEAWLSSTVYEQISRDGHGDHC